MFLMLRVAALASALVSAAAPVTVGVTARVRFWLSVWLLPCQVPALDWWTTRSPPTTSRPR